MAKKCLINKSQGTPKFKVRAYNFASTAVTGRLRLNAQPSGWNLTLPKTDFPLAARARGEIEGTLIVPRNAAHREGWIKLQADCGPLGHPVLAFRIIARDETN